MNNSKEHMSKSQLEQLIESYFAGSTSEAEEKLLKQELVTTQHQSRTINEARAVLGYFAVSKVDNVQKINRYGAFTRNFVAAASLILCVTIAVKFMTTNVSTVYINGDEITSNTLALSMMTDDLKCMAEASENVSNDISHDLSLIKDVYNEIN